MAQRRGVAPHRLVAVGPVVDPSAARRQLAEGVVLRGHRAPHRRCRPGHGLRCWCCAHRGAAASDARIERRSLELLAAAGLPDPFPWDAEARQLFADLFFAGPGAIEVIETLDQVGLWVQLLPEWEPVRCKPQRNAYHRFTVDRHLCEAAVGAAALADRVGRPDLLVIGALLHDIGKGYPGDHTEVGVDILAAIGERMGYAPTTSR
jgi:[protein-PII] uridylyltransferase